MRVSRQHKEAIDDIGADIAQGAADLATKLAGVMERERDALGEFASLIILAAPAYLAELYSKRAAELGTNPVSAAFLGIVEAPLDRALEAVGGGRVGRNRDMWKDQCARQADKLRAFNGEAPTDDMARALVAEHRSIYPGVGWPALPEAKRLIRAALSSTGSATNVDSDGER